MHTKGTDGISDLSLKRQDWARLVRKPLKSKGHALLDVCTPDGDLQRKVERLVDMTNGCTSMARKIQTNHTLPEGHFLTTC